MKGQVAIYRLETYIEEALWKLQNQLWLLNKTSQITCYMIKEPLIPLPGSVTFSSLFVSHMASYFETTMNHIMESGILNELTKFMIWQQSKLLPKPWEKHQDFKLSGLHDKSKILVIFLILLFGLGISGLCCFVEKIAMFCISNRNQKLVHPIFITMEIASHAKYIKDPGAIILSSQELEIQRDKL
jgi:hypothetical protein